MMVWLSMSCMYVSVRTAAGGTSYFGMSAQGMASRSRAPERATQASRSNRAIAVGQKYYPRRVQTSGKASPAHDHHWWLRREHPPGEAPAGRARRVQEPGGQEEGPPQVSPPPAPGRGGGPPPPPAAPDRAAPRTPPTTATVGVGR